MASLAPAAGAPDPRPSLRPSGPPVAPAPDHSFLLNGPLRVSCGRWNEVFSGRSALGRLLAPRRPARGYALPTHGRCDPYNGCSLEGRRSDPLGRTSCSLNVRGARAPARCAFAPRAITRLIRLGRRLSPSRRPRPRPPRGGHRVPHQVRRQASPAQTLVSPASCVHVSGRARCVQVPVQLSRRGLSLARGALPFRFPGGTRVPGARAGIPGALPPPDVLTFLSRAS